MFKKQKIVIYLIPFIIIVSCKTSRIIKTEVEFDYQQDKINYIIEKEKNDYKSLGIRKVTGKYQDKENKLSFSGSIRIKRDSLILCSFGIISGIENFRILFSPDSVKYIDRVNKVYFKGKYDQFKKLAGIETDYLMLQSIITKQFNIYVERNEYVYNPENSEKNNNIEYTRVDKEIENNNYNKKAKLDKIIIDRETGNIVGISINYEKEKKEIGIRYDNIIRIGNSLFASEIYFDDINVENNSIANIKLSKIEINKKYNYLFRISGKYQRIY